MERVYISSTVEDLSEYRYAVADVLRKCGYEVDSMEKYSARDERPRAACEKDASECDIYVGIFAWRYGYIPGDGNPEAKSITELEYLAAERSHKPRLIFILDDTYAWPPALLDGQQDTGGKKIRDLRTRLKTERWASTFKTPDDLANQVMISVTQYRSMKTVEMLSEIQNINDAKEFGPSYLPNIQQQINQPTSQFVALRLGPVPWWDTRLHLAAALTSDFTEIQQFILLDGERRYLTMAPPVEIRRALANSSPNLETFYYNSRARAIDVGPNAIGMGPNEADRTIGCYPDAVKDTFPDGKLEEQIKRVITPTFLRGLGIRSQGEVLDLFGSGRWSSQDIVRRRAPYVVVMRNGMLEGVIDRMELSSRIASLLLQM